VDRFADAGEFVFLCCHGSAARAAIRNQPQPSRRRRKTKRNERRP
jgi:hypothetical protein